MEKEKRKIKILESARWFSFVPGLIIYIATNGVFADWISIVLVLGFMFGFSAICNAEKKRIVWENIVSDMRAALDSVGQTEALFEVKKIKIGMVVRVYLIRAKHRSAICSKAIIESISDGWYRRYICATQIVDINKKEEMKDAQFMLDEDLVEDMRKKLEERRRKKDR